MKKWTRLTALVLALMMCLCVSASAAEPITDTDKATVTVTDGLTGATVTFTDNDGEKLEVTYESASIVDGQFYLVMVVAADSDGNYVPTKDTILYIDQTTGTAGSVSFTVYPSDIKDSAILIYGTGIDGEANFLIAAIIDAKYIIGDVDQSGEVNIGDVTMLLRYLADLVEDTSTVSMEAADTDGSSAVNVGDVTKLLRVLAGLTSF